MLKGIYPKAIYNIPTPFYYYDLNVLRATIKSIKQETTTMGCRVHYALKANANRTILTILQEDGFGADCVSGGEINAALKAGISPSDIVFAGVGKADWEIQLGLEHRIFCFNVESVPELQVINDLAKAKGVMANVALRINPNVSAHTHHYITTGLSENKFGIDVSELGPVLELCRTLSHIKLIGIHFHIGSQITDMTAFQNLCVKANEIQQYFSSQGYNIEHINVGGGLGVNYEHPNHFPVPDFGAYFAVFRNHLMLAPHQTLHVELGRSVVAQCGSLISRVLYVKQGATKKFVILDAGFTELIRPALYQAYHRIENISSNLPPEQYDVVGPICESSDTFAKDMYLNQTQRGDIIAIRSAGGYGEAMASQYNLRALPDSYFSDDIID